MKSIKIAMIDDHELVRNGLKMLVESFGNYTVAIQAANGEDFIEKLKDETELPEIALIDIAMPIMDGFETISYLRKEFPSIKCVGLSFQDDYTSVFRMIEVGAKAYLLKDSPMQLMKDTIEAVLDKESYFSSFVVNKLMDYNSVQEAKREIEHAFARTADITERELQFMKWCCSELTYKEIADKMQVKLPTVDGYRASLFDKLGLKNRVGIVLYAIHNKIFTI
jgi:DNA-binding NarL/FixJ family response regulator